MKNSEVIALKAVLENSLHVVMPYEHAQAILGFYIQVINEISSIEQQKQSIIDSGAPDDVILNGIIELYGLPVTPSFQMLPSVYTKYLLLTPLDSNLLSKFLV